MNRFRSTTTRRTAIAAGVVAMGVALAACGGGSSGGSTSSAAPAGSGSTAALDAALQKGGTITYWTWTPAAKAQVAAFEKAYPNAKVNLVNAGTGTDEYTKLQNAVSAGSGAPDVAQVEYFALPQFALTNSLLDLNQYGLGSLKSDYSSGVWGSVNIGGKLVGLPQDSGPMAMFYNKTEFDKYKIAVPKTWDEYIAAAKKLHAADPSKYITSDTGDPGFVTSMIWQAGGRPFTVNGTDVKINFKDPGTQKFTAMWNQLVQGKLLSNINGWTDAWYKGLGDGTIATLITGAWMPGNLESSVAKASGDWRVAPMPTYDGQAATTAENGGSSQAVTKQSKNPALAAAFLRWLNNDPASLKIFADSGGFPSTTAELSAPTFTSQKIKYFGGQQANQVLTDASNQVSSGFSYLPYEVYANSIFNDTVGKSYINNSDLNAGLQSWASELEAYGKKQGFSVSGS